MRTNSIDATTFRCLAEYNNLVIIYSKLYEKDYDYHIKDYLEELIECDTIKEVREKHVERINFINERIDKYLLQHKKRIKIGGLYRDEVVDTEVLSENVVIENDLRPQVNFKINSK